MKHKNAEMIIAAANNTELAVFVKVIDQENESGNYWAISSLSTLVTACNEFFLCLPQHKDACLHWLNGGDVQVRDFVTSPFCDVTDWSKEWLRDGCGFMVKKWIIRIKPKKEKRWILEYNGTLITTKLFTSEGAARLWIEEFDRTDEGVSVIEIEVEV